MLVLTVQDDSVVQKLNEGKYKADFWKTRLGCLSPRFTKGYNLISKEIKRRVNRYCEVPIFAWGGTPFIESIRCGKGKKVLFLEVPEEELVFSDYDKFCDYVYGISSDADFMLSKKKAKSLVSRGYCVQVSTAYIKPEWVVSTVDFSLIGKFEGTVDDCYRYYKILQAYFELA